MDLSALRKLLANHADIGDPPSPCETVEVTLRSVGDLVRIVEREHLGSFQYRGQACCSWKLLPSLTRRISPGTTGLDVDGNESVRYKECHILKEFRSRIAAYRGSAPSEELTLAIVAQHHETPTRLLDWTMNPLASLFFAVEDSDNWLETCSHCNNKDCSPVVWAAKGNRHRVSDFPVVRFDELENRPYFVIPDHDETRAAVQSSIFALWGDPTVPFTKLSCEGQLWRISIPRPCSRHVLWTLHCLGITRETLFPDVDGLGKYLAWKHRHIHQSEFQKSGRPEPRNC